MATLNSIIQVQVSRETRFPTRKGFGVPMFAAYHTKWSPRALRVENIQELVDLGVDPVTDKVLYDGVGAAFAQDPSPEAVIIGRRVRPSTQLIHLSPLNFDHGYEYDLTVIDPAGLAADLTYVVPSVGPTTAAASLTFAAGNTITRAAGSWITDGFAIGESITITGSASNDGHSGAIITGLSATVITCAATVFTAEGPTIAATIVGSIDQFTISHALATLIDAVADVVATASAGVVAAATTAGKLAVYRNLPPLASLGFADVSTDPGIASDLAEILTAASLSPTTSFYAVTLDHTAKAIALSAAAWTETNKLLFIVRNSDSLIADPGTPNDFFSALVTSAYKRTGPIFAQSSSQDYRDMAWIGTRLPQDPGSNIWAFSPLSGVAADKLLDGEATAIENKRASTYREIAGVNVTFEGATPAGEFIDLVISSDFLAARIQEAVFGAILSTPKFDYTDLGIAAIVNVAQGVLNDNITSPGNPKMLAPDPAPLCIATKKALDVDPAIRASRRYGYFVITGRFSGAVQGASFRIILAV